MWLETNLTLRVKGRKSFREVADELDFGFLEELLDIMRMDGADVKGRVIGADKG